MTRYLVTVCRDELIYDSGPAVVVVAETVERAAVLAIDRLRESDGGYGVVCGHCENLTPTELSVFELDRATVVRRNNGWTAEDEGYWTDRLGMP